MELNTQYYIQVNSFIIQIYRHSHNQNFIHKIINTWIDAAAADTKAEMIQNPSNKYFFRYMLIHQNLDFMHFWWFNKAYIIY